MTARILVVDDLLPNVKLLEARLSEEYFDVLTATSGAEALRLCEHDHCDLVLLDVMMPDMDGFETCRRLKANPATAHIPVMMVTALDEAADRIKGLEAGADDFLTKPIDEVALLARVRSLTRLKVVLDELRSRASAVAVLGVAGALPNVADDMGLGGRVLLVDDKLDSVERLAITLASAHYLTIERRPEDALLRTVRDDYDLVIVSLGLQDYDALRLCGQLRSLERTRQLPILLIAGHDDKARILRGLDIGVNDYVNRPTDRTELLTRVATQVRRKRYSDSLREQLRTSIEMAVVDSLTGLNNRRYLESHLKALMTNAASRGKPLSMMIVDLDHFKSVNDTFGHDVGDEVLRGFASRVKKVIRAGDVMCRLGGEEFIIVLPETNIEIAELVAERVRSAVGHSAFPVERGTRTLSITVSIGIADRGGDSDPGTLFKRADLALYRSKRGGRNMVSAHAA
ncbi:PleD family two-component system response regulator [Lichenihabitans sp. PAMC28606]|uniref:PleD family two-component system response regulator n=1 Tax=Lichenihabitans sp. PAMC28606 TaxID=2880932 RepID=UPI001D0BE3EC|nr:PleD family two-component system response regulator [Lichenihabitans sp. PAMC28606]UDL95307.1 PleD family two-component system response regulator [Lichenihabitans sp. PAMC28606]